MSAPDITDPNADLADSARRITHAWMAHLGYEPGQIAAAETQEHAGLCEFNGEFWECDDGNGVSHHPVRDEMDNAAAMVMFVLERLGPTPATAEPVDDLQDIRTKWLRFCSHDLDLPYPCICPNEDHRSVIAALVTEVETLRAEVARLEGERAEAGRAARGLTSALIAVADRLDVPYTDEARWTDRPEWTPWSRFVAPALRRLRAALAIDPAVEEADIERLPEWESDLLLSQAMTERDQARADLAALHAEAARLATDRAKAHAIVDDLMAERNAALDKRDHARTAAANMRQARNAAQAERSALGPLVEAVLRFVEIESGRSAAMENCSAWLEEQKVRRAALIAAVDQMAAHDAARPTRGLSPQVPNSTGGPQTDGSAVDQMAPSGPPSEPQGDDQGAVAGTDTVEAQEGTQRLWRHGGCGYIATPPLPVPCPRCGNDAEWITAMNTTGPTPTIALRSEPLVVRDV
jgi:hypothetical protein